MTRFYSATALLAALAAGASAQAPIQPASGVGYPSAMPSSGYAPPETAAVAADPYEVVGQRYGLLPFLRKGVFWKKNYGACASCEREGLLARLGHGGLPGHGGHGGGDGGPAFPGEGVPGVPQPGQPGMGMPGTLVFPYNPYTRSPRDYFMYEKR